MTKRKYTGIKFCIVCGKRIPENSPRHKICSNECRLKRRQFNKKGLPAPYENCTEPPAQAKPLSEINAEARRSGLSYGQFMAERYAKQNIAGE